MSVNWDKCKETYSSHYPLSAQEEDHLYAQFKDYFCANVSGERYLFAHWLNFVIYSKGPGHHWRYINEQIKLSHEEFVTSFLHHEQITNLNAHKGTGFFEGKEIKWDQPQFHWKYLNNRTVHFNHSVTSPPDSFPSHLRPSSPPNRTTRPPSPLETGPLSPPTRYTTPSPPRQMCQPQG